MAALGFTPAGQLPGFNETETAKVALFESSTGKVKSVRFEITIAPTVAIATTQFTALADALKNPPPGLFGADTKQTDGQVVFQADQSRSYKTDKPDKEGTLVFSDIHRFGRTIVIMYSIGPDAPETAGLRKQLAEQLSAKAPR